MSSKIAKHVMSLLIEKSGEMIAYLTNRINKVNHHFTYPEEKTIEMVNDPKFLESLCNYITCNYVFNYSETIDDPAGLRSNTHGPFYFHIINQFNLLLENEYVEITYLKTGRKYIIQKYEKGWSILWGCEKPNDDYPKVAKVLYSTIMGAVISLYMALEY